MSHAFKIFCSCFHGENKAWNIMAQNATTVDKLRDAVAMLMEKKRDWYLYHGHYADLLKPWGREIHCYSMLIINQKQMNAPVIREVPFVLKAYNKFTLYNMKLESIESYRT